MGQRLTGTMLATDCSLECTANAAGVAIAHRSLSSFMLIDVSLIQLHGGPASQQQC